MDNTICWNVAVSRETDQSVRDYLAEEGLTEHGDLSHLVEEALGLYLFRETARETKAAVAAMGMTEQEIEDLIEEAVQEVRQERRAQEAAKAAKQATKKAADALRPHVRASRSRKPALA